MTIRTAPCRWPADFTDCADIEEIEGSGDPEVYIEMATEFLWNWTGRQFGLCEISVRPCRQDCSQRVSTFGSFLRGSAPWQPVIINGAWYNLECGSCGNKCGCRDVESLKLPGPIHSIQSITIDGEVLPSGNYRVDNHKYVIRLDGGVWPTCQNMDAAVGEADTWEITYTRGVPVPVGGQVSAGLLASELAKMLCGDTTCKLPTRFQNITRQGVSIGAVLDTFEGLDEGRTGLWVVDSWIASIMKAPKPSRVLSPDLRPKGQRQTWP